MIATFDNSLEFISHVKAALRAVSEDETRPHLNALRIELVKGTARFISTNGHWLWVSELPYREITGVDEKGKPVSAATSSAALHISRADVLAILKGVDKAKRAASMKLDVDTEAVSVRQGAATISFTNAPVTFPPYGQVLPSGVTDEAQLIAFDPSYVAAVSEAFAEIAEGRNCGVRFQASGDELSPVIVTSDRSTALAVIMPRRPAKDAPSADALLARYRAAAAEAAA